MTHPQLGEILRPALVAEEGLALGTATGADAAPDDAALLEELLLRLVAHRNEHGILPLDHDGCEILLDAELRGVRCRFTRTRPPTPAVDHNGRITLSPRELEIARMVARGYPNKTIASVLDISAWTVSTYLRRMFSKIGVCSRAALVNRLHEAGILIEPSSQDGL